MKKILFFLLLIGSASAIAGSCNVALETAKLKDKMENTIREAELTDDRQLNLNDIADVDYTDSDFKLTIKQPEEGFKMVDDCQFSGEENMAPGLDVLLAGEGLIGSISNGDDGDIAMASVNLAGTLLMDALADAAGAAASGIGVALLIANISYEFDKLHKIVNGYKTNLKNIASTYGKMISGYEKALHTLDIAIVGTPEEIIDTDLDYAHYYIYEMNKTELNYLFAELANTGYESIMKKIFGNKSFINNANNVIDGDDNATYVNHPSTIIQTPEYYDACIKETSYSAHPYAPRNCTIHTKYNDTRLESLDDVVFYNYPSISDTTLDSFSSTLSSLKREIIADTALINYYSNDNYDGPHTGKINRHFSYGDKFGDLYITKKGALLDIQEKAIIWLYTKYLPRVNDNFFALVNQNDIIGQFIEFYKKQLSDVNAMKKIADTSNKLVEEHLSWLYLAKYFAEDINRLVPDNVDADEAGVFFATVFDQIDPLSIFGLSTAKAALENEIKELNEIYAIITLTSYFINNKVSINDTDTVDFHINKIINSDASSVSGSIDRSIIATNVRNGVEAVKGLIADKYIDKSTIREKHYTEEIIKQLHAKADARMDEIEDNLETLLQEKYAFKGVDLPTHLKRFIGRAMLEGYSQVYNKAGTFVANKLSDLQTLVDSQNLTKEDLLDEIEDVAFSMKQYYRDISTKPLGNTDYSFFTHGKVAGVKELLLETANWLNSYAAALDTPTDNPPVDDMPTDDNLTPSGIDLISGDITSIPSQESLISRGGFSTSKDLARKNYSNSPRKAVKKPFLKLKPFY